MDSNVSINDRIIQIMEHEGLSVAAFARKTGLGDQAVRSVCVMKRNKPSFEFLLKVVQTFGWLNTKWLLTGDGEMEVPPGERRTEAADLAGEVREMINYLRERDIINAETLREKDRRIEELLVESTSWRVKYELSTKA